MNPDSVSDQSIKLPLVERIPLIPIRSKPHGPLISRRVNRTLLGLALTWFIGVGLCLAEWSPAWSAFGLSLVMPGAGFLYSGGGLGVLFFAIAFLLFPVSLFVWWATGNILAPIFTWLGGALLSAAWIGDAWGNQWVTIAAPLAVALLWVVFMLMHRSAFNSAVARGKEHNEAIATTKPVVKMPPKVTVEGELNVPQLHVLRATIEKGLQPIDQWEGFTFTEQFQMGSLRYQLSTASWNMAVAQYCFMPAFKGYLNESQHNMIEKNLDKKNWDYWYLENLWGHLESNPDPIRKDNIMLSGFMGTSLALYEIASGCREFDEPKSLTFAWDKDKQFVYDNHSLNQAIAYNYKRYDLGWMPCEPNWVYSMCNLLGMTSLKGYDRVHGTNLLESVMDRFERTLEEELLLADGRIRVCTSSKFGFTVPTLSSMMGESSGIRPLLALAPEKAERLWQVVRRDFIRLGDGKSFNPKLLDWGWDTRHTFNLKPLPDIAPLGSMLGAAVEMGDTEVIDVVSEYLDAKYGAGVSDSMKITRCGAWYDMFNRGRPEHWDAGPALGEAAFSEVMVARANTDGKALDLVLHPVGDCRQSDIILTNLIPDQVYKTAGCMNGEIKADHNGAAKLSIPLAGRSELHVTPGNI